MKLRTLLIWAAGIERFLRCLGEPTEPPPLEPARGPPYFKTRALRRKFGELDAHGTAQVEMFGA